MAVKSPNFCYPTQLVVISPPTNCYPTQLVGIYHGYWPPQVVISCDIPIKSHPAVGLMKFPTVVTDRD